MHPYPEETAGPSWHLLALVLRTLRNSGVVWVLPDSTDGTTWGTARTCCALIEGMARGEIIRTMVEAPWKGQGVGGTRTRPMG